MDKTPTRITAIILAGGTGSRMRTSTPKQFLELKGRPVIMYSVEIFAISPHISDIVIVCHKEYIKLAEQLVKVEKTPKIHKIIPGGKTRQESAYLGLKNCPKDTTHVLIHDAARPFVDNAMIKRTISAAVKYKAATTAVDVTDTVIEISTGKIIKFLDRDKLRRVQTPQGFEYKTILSAHEKARKEGFNSATDDCVLAMTYGTPVKIVNGSEKNKKITRKGDILYVQDRDDRPRLLGK
ncbi:MAG: 2-C-methyl-D-erythritol 4-phosphate cytidylyltransferase [Candidatus Omnitrophica bacterium]|nr:2-C-methyl-D-erythritol 4-phosphate cytidylyltransferase [Candidatus Omnitrophota bacterium]